VHRLSTSLHYYESVLGMRRLLTAQTEPPGTALVGYSEAEQPFLRLQSITQERTQRDGRAMEEEESAAEELILEAWEGRHAIAMPERELRLAYQAAKDIDPDLVLHPIRSLQDKLGTLVLAIILDPNGYEICLVSAETFDRAVLARADWKGPDWQKRQLAEEAAAKRGASPFA